MAKKQKQPDRYDVEKILKKEVRDGKVSINYLNWCKCFHRSRLFIKFDV